MWGIRMRRITTMQRSRTQRPCGTSVSVCYCAYTLSVCWGAGERGNVCVACVCTCACACMTRRLGSGGCDGVMGAGVTCLTCLLSGMECGVRDVMARMWRPLHIADYVPPSRAPLCSAPSGLPAAAGAGPLQSCVRVVAVCGHVRTHVFYPALPLYCTIWAGQCAGACMQGKRTSPTHILCAMYQLRATQSYL